MKIIWFIFISLVELIIVGLPWIIGYVILITIFILSDRKYAKDIEKRKGYQPTPEEMRAKAKKDRERK